MHPLSIRRSAVALATVLLVGTSLMSLPTSAGPLDPPAGSIAPTHKTLTEVEPRIPIDSTNTPGDADSLFKITQPGSYYLTGNITGVVGKHGIEITTTGVTLDLNGFDLRGINGMGPFDGVLVTAPGGSGGTFVTIRNGSVRSWGDCGIEMPNIVGAVATGIVEGIQARSNARHGIALQGSGSVVTRCMSFQNGADGINVSTSTTISHCTANFNAGNGIAANHSCNITHCLASGNDESGFDLNSGCVLTACSATFNLDGFRGLGGCAYIDCNAYNNNGTGIVASEGSTVDNCLAYLNAVDGIAASESAVRDCTVTSNDANGIRAGSDCQVTGNTCDGNGLGTSGGAGILVTGSDCLIEGNRCSDTDRGIEVTAAGNFIARNVCSGNTTNWDVVAGNQCFVVLGVDSAVILGDSGGVSPGSTNPNANFTY